LCFAIGVVFFLSLLVPARGQETGQFYKKPETADEYWKYMNHEIELGQFRVAAGYLKAFVGKNPSDEDLLRIQEKEGSSAFQRLLNIPEMRADAKALVERVDAVVQKHLADRKRLDALIKNLTDVPEEREYAIGQLRRSGAQAVPALVDALIRSANEPEEHTAILRALARLDKTTVPPLLAALDADNTNLRIELINLLRQRAATEATPFLWYLAASPKQPEAVRKAATAALTAFLSLPAERLPLARVALTEQAEGYYQHKVGFSAAAPVPVWRWDGKQLVMERLSSSQAEEYYGLRFARQALELDPSYQSAQIVFLSLALDKGMERAAGLDQPLSKGAAPVKELLNSVNPELLIAVLDRALKERRLTVVVGSVRALGDLSEVRAAQPAGRGTPALVRALNYPDRRVQMAAAEALLRIGGQAQPLASSRVINILRRMLLIDASQKVLVADFDKDRAALVGQALQKAGFEPVVVQTGKEALKRLGQAGDIDALLIDSAIPDPQLPHLLAQLRADIDSGGLPILVTTSADQIDHLQRQVEPYRNVWVVETSASANGLKREVSTRITEALGRPLTEAERKDYAAKSMEWLVRLARGEVAGYDLRPAEGAILQSLRSKELAPLAVEAAGRLPGREPQLALATVVLTANLPEALRSAAAVELCRHIQHHGLALSTNQIQALESLFKSQPDSNFKANVALVVGSMHPDARQTGERLQRYVPTLAAPAKAATPPAPKKEKEEEASKGND
jgi:CheY-like chemotaxis protein